MKNFRQILFECMSEEDIAKYFPEGWDPTKRNGGYSVKSNPDGDEPNDEWLTSPNPDDYVAILYDEVKKRAEQENYTPEDIGNIASHAFWAGNSRGFANAKQSALEGAFDNEDI